MARILDRGQTHATGTAVDQDCLARLQPGQVADSIGHGQERDRNCCGGGEVELGRHMHHRVRGGDRVRAERGRRERHHPIANCEVGDVRADRGHHTGAFQAQSGTGKAVEQRLVRQKTHRPHHVTEVQACRLDENGKLAGTWAGRRGLDPAERVQQSRPLHGEAECGRASVGRRQSRPNTRHQPARENEGDLLLAIPRRQLDGQPLCGFRRRERWIDADHAGA